MPNLLFILVPLLCAGLLFLKPARRLIAYCAKNTAAVLFFILLSLSLSAFGVTLSVNMLSLASALLLGLPGISLALFLALII